MAGVFFKTYAEAASYARRRAQKLGVPVKFARSSEGWVVISDSEHRHRSKELSPLDIKMREDMADLAREMTESTDDDYFVAAPTEESPFWSVQPKKHS